MSSEHLNDLDTKINVKGYFERILAEREKRDAERDKRLDERFDSQEKAVAAALSAAEKAVSAALLAAEKAVEKAEAAQQRVNVTQNEFRGTLKDQAADLMPRSETELLVNDLRGGLDGLKSFQAKIIGAVGVAMFAMPTLTAVIVYLLTAP